MIHYQLRCTREHGFDGWFKDSATFEQQAKLGLIECPECGGTEVERALMAPAVSRRAAPPMPIEAPQSPAAASPSASPSAVAPVEVPAEVKLAAGRIPAQVVAVLQRIRAEEEKNCDYVGPDFADEARKIHHGETERRSIYGEATEEEAESLAEEGIDIGRIPWVPRADG
nr:DUF1178 family protein [uncultured Rhodopila sp.]